MFHSQNCCPCQPISPSLDIPPLYLLDHLVPKTTLQYTNDFRLPYNLRHPHLLYIPQSLQKLFTPRYTYFRYLLSCSSTHRIVLPHRSLFDTQNFRKPLYLTNLRRYTQFFLWPRKRQGLCRRLFLKSIRVTFPSKFLFHFYTHPNNRCLDFKVFRVTYPLPPHPFPMNPFHCSTVRTGMTYKTF